MSARGIGLVLLASLMVVAAGCTTHADFILPEGTTIRFEQDKKLTTSPSGEVVRRPFFWNVAGGIKYELLDNGKVVGKGQGDVKVQGGLHILAPLCHHLLADGLSRAVV